MERVTRPLLARAGEQRLLSPQAIDIALDLAGLRPTRSEWRNFAVIVLRFAAVLSLAAGLIFLIAFNWENLGLLVRFALVEAPLLATLVIAWIKGADTTPGKLA